MSTVACGNPLAPPPTSFRPLGASACPTTPGPHWTHVTDLLNLLRSLHQFMPLGDCSPVATHRKPGVRVQSKPLQPQLPGCLATVAVTSGAPQWRKTPVATRRGGVGWSGWGFCPALVAMENIARRWAWPQGGSCCKALNGPRVPSRVRSVLPLPRGSPSGPSLSDSGQTSVGWGARGGKGCILFVQLVMNMDGTVISVNVHVFKKRTYLFSEHQLWPKHSQQILWSDIMWDYGGVRFSKAWNFLILPCIFYTYEIVHTVCTCIHFIHSRLKPRQKYFTY